MRPDGADVIFGGAGTRIGRNDESFPTTDADRHARDADTIVGDNGNIIRLVSAGTTTGYLSFNYDTYGALKVVPRGVTLLDYTPGGPIFNAAAASDIGAADELHGEAGDDMIYGGKGNDIQ